MKCLSLSLYIYIYREREREKHFKSFLYIYIYIYIYIYAFSRRFYPKRLIFRLYIFFVSTCVPWEFFFIIYLVHCSNVVLNYKESIWKDCSSCEVDLMLSDIRNQVSLWALILWLIQTRWRERQPSPAIRVLLWSIFHFHSFLCFHHQYYRKSWRTCSICWGGDSVCPNSF